MWQSLVDPHFARMLQSNGFCPKVLAVKKPYFSNKGNYIQFYGWETKSYKPSDLSNVILCTSPED